MLTIALSHLLGRGLRLETHEAIALARELLAHPCGIPTPENIQLGSDGSVSLTSSAGVPTVASIAHLLLTLLPGGNPHVPASLRYAIARGLESVEAPAFASLSEFSNELARFEKGASRDVLRGVLQRGARPSRPSAAPTPVARSPVTPTAARPSPPVVTRPAVVPPRPTLVVRTPAVSSTERTPPIAVAPPTLRSFGDGGEARTPVHSWWRLPLAAAAAFVVSFTVGSAVTDGITDRRAATQPAGSAGVAQQVSGVAHAANESAAAPSEVKTRDEFLRVPSTAAASRQLAPLPAATRDEVLAVALSGTVDHRDAQVRPIQALGSTKGNTFSPAFAPDGTSIFFHTGAERDGRSAIAVATPATETGGQARIMTIVDDGSHNYHPQPSPDGRLVAFDSDRDGERGIYVANRDGSQVRRLSGAGSAAVPTWSRNSEWLAYIRPEVAKPAVWNLWVQPAAGGSARRVTNYRYGQTWAASWFPDDRRIAYSHEDTLVVMDLQTGADTRYAAPVKGQLVRTPAVSPDGRIIIFQVFRHGVWLLDLADGSMERVLTDPTAEEFAWSPDGRRVAFHSRRAGQWGVYLMSRR